MARPFKRVKGTSKGCDEYAVEHNRRPYVFNFAIEGGGTIECDGSVSIESVGRLLEIFKELQALE